MKTFFTMLRDLFFGRKPAYQLLRAAAALLLGILLLWRPEIARQALAALVWLPLLPVAAAGVMMMMPGGRHRAAGVAVAAAALIAAGCIFTLGMTKLAIVGAGLWALIAAAGLLSNAFFTGGRKVDWQVRLIGAAGGVMTGAAGYVFLMRRRLDFMETSTLFGVFFIALALLTVAELSWSNKKS